MEILYLIGSFLVLIICFWILHFTTDNFFIPSLDKISRRYSIPSDVAGSTLMAAGSSAPELAVALIAMLVAGNHEAIGIGTIVGSSLFNALVIVGYALFVGTNRITSWSPIYRDLLFYLISVVLLYYFFQDGYIYIFEAILLISIYGLYIVTMLYWKKWFGYKDHEKPEMKSVGKNHSVSKWILITFYHKLYKSVSPYFNRHLFLAFMISIVIITFISWVLVKVAIFVSVRLQIHEMVIGLTVIAVGTSIPDLMSSGIVARKGRTGMAINNSIGSNVFDILIGLGLPILIYTLLTDKPVPVENQRLLWSFSLLLISIAILFIVRYLYKTGRMKLIGIFLMFIYLLFLFIEISGIRLF